MAHTSRSSTVLAALSLLLPSSALQAQTAAYPPGLVGQVEPTQAQTPPPEVVLSEVCYLPKAGEAEWIELTNVSTQGVDLKGWRLVDGQAIDFALCDQPLVIPPQGFLVVRLDGTGGPTTPFDKGTAVAHSPEGVTGNLLGDRGGQIALYAPPLERLDQPVVHSFIAWGRSPGRVLADAIQAGRWSVTGGGQQEVVLGTAPDFGSVFLKRIELGGSIGLVHRTPPPGHPKDAWGIFAPSEVNPGKLVTTRGITLARPFDGGKTSEEGKFTLSVIRMEAGVPYKYQFQVCEDKGCERVFLDVTQEADNYMLEKPIPRHTTYYWRARLLRPDGSTSAWSEVRSLTNGYPK